MSRYLVTVETVKIKDFIFSTNKLKLIRGASYLLDYLNQVEVPAILKNNELDKDRDVIYIGAGNAKFFVDTEERAKKIIKEIKDKYKTEAPNAKIAASYRETTFDGRSSEKGKEKIWEVMDNLAQDVAVEKSKGFYALNIDLPFIKKCDLCGNNPVEVSVDNLEEDLENLGIYLLDKEEINKLKGQIKKLSQDEKICEECLRKLISSNRIKLDKEKIGFYGKVKEEFGEINFENTEIEDYEGSKSFIGFMYSDGDGLGDFLKNISEEFKKENSEEAEKKYVEFLKDFSKTLDENTKSALMKVLKNKREILVKEKGVIGEFLIVGGDDVCAVFSPDLVIEISNEFQKEFESLMLEYANENKIDTRITSSSGVVIAKSKTPMFHLFDQALGLQKKAKAERYRNGEKTTGYIDFQVIGSEGCVDITAFRNKISPEENKVMERPYRVNEEKKHKETLDSLIKKIKEFKEKDFPKTKLRYIYDLKTGNNLEEYEKKMEFVNTLSKMKENHIELVKIDYKDYENFNKNFSDIFDVLELYDFVGGDNSEDKL